ncbi:DUF6765 family protein [Burkholderia gladioli]|uniref:DUF6765 family protein n=1 Tax=Burkholderia gladioli TaxID=28095 RepID=UPI0016406450|nr:DUF6765 family protein [Burkholderia gladioli]
MNIDFHYGVVYAMARLGGLSVGDATTVAHACQYIDDSTTPGVLQFRDGELFERFAAAHSMADYHNVYEQGNRLTWVPFHFLPAGQGETLEEKAICRPDSDVAREVVRHTLRLSPATGNRLHRLGVTLHTYVDTWAHQGFSGIESDYNRVSRLEAEDCTPENWLQHLERATAKLVKYAETAVLSRAFPLGHGAALHYPDQPWAVWSYINGKGEKVPRDNLPDFIKAANMACRVVQAFVAGRTDFEARPGLTVAQEEALTTLLRTNRDDDVEARLKGIGKAIADGTLPGLKEVLPNYIAKGKGSWKYLATEIESDGDGHVKPVWSEGFEQSDYRKFHDAVKEHRFVVNQQVLPQIGLRLA